MPSLLSGGKPLKGTYGSSTIYISLPTAQISLGTTPTTSTGYTLVTGATGQLGFTSTLGGVYFQNSVIQTNTPNGDITIQSNGTGKLNLNGNVFINGQNLTVNSGTFTDLVVTNTARFTSSATNVFFAGGYEVNGVSNFNGDFNAFGNVFLESYGKNVVIAPTGIGSVEIYPETVGTIDNMEIGARIASSATFTTLAADNLTVGGMPIGGGSSAAVISDTPPASPYVGELWWDSTIGVLRVYYNDGVSSQWVDAFPVIAGADGPAGPAGAPGQIADVTTLTLYINNSTLATSTNTGALKVLGGVGVGGDLYAGTIYSNGSPVLTAVNTSWFGVSEILVGGGLVADTTTGIVTILNVDTLNSVIGRGNSTTNTLLINNNTPATSTATGSLQVSGGVGIGGDLFVGKSINVVGADNTYGSLSYNSVGDTFITPSIIPDVEGTRSLGTSAQQWNSLYASQIYENGLRLVTSMKPLAGPGIGISYISTTGPVIVFTITNLGVYALYAGTDTAVSQSTGSVTVWNTSNLQSVTSRGATTTNAISITNFGNNALNVSGRINAGSMYAAGSEVWTKATLTDDSQLTNGAGYLTPQTLGLYGVTYLYAGYGIRVNANTGTITLTNTGVVSLTTGSGISISTSSGAVIISSNDTLASVIRRGSSSPYSMSITSSTAATTVTSGALVVTGGVGISGSLYSNSIYDNGNRVINRIQVNASSGISGGGTITGPNGTISLTNTGVLSLFAGTDTAITAGTGNITIWNTSNLQSVTDKGNQTTNAINITNETSATSTTTGALTVTGGIGIQGDLYANLMYSKGSLVITKETFGLYGVSELYSGPGISVDAHTGTVTVSSTATLELVTSYGGSTPYVMSITNATQASTTTNSGALRVTGGAGIGGNLYAKNIYDNAVRVITALNPIAGTAIGVSEVDYTGPLATFTITNLGVQSVANGVETTVSASTGSNVQINVTSTLQSITVRGSTTDRAIRITNATSSTSEITGALVVNGGVGIGGDVNIDGAVSINKDLRVSGAVTFSSNVTFSGSATYVLSTNTYYTDNVIDIHTPPTSMGTFWNIDDGKDIGVRYNYFNRALNTGTSGALVLSNNSQYLEWYSTATDTGTGNFVNPTYGTFKTGSLILVDATSSTNILTGALTVAGGVGIVGDVYAGGGIWSAGSKVVTEQSLGVLGVVSLYAGTDTAVSSNTGSVTVWNISTLQSITNRGFTTTNAINISNTTPSTTTTNGALRVQGGVGIAKDLFVGGDAQISGNIYGGQLLGLLTNTSVNATALNSGIQIGSTPIASLLYDGVLGWKSLGDISPNGIYNLGSSTNHWHLIHGDAVYDNSNRVLTQVTINPGVGMSGGGSINGPTGSVTITNAGVTATIGTAYLGVSAAQGAVTFTNLGVQSISANGTETSVSATTGSNIEIYVKSTLQNVTSRGSSSTYAINITNTTSATNTYSGALVVGGGLGVGGTIYASDAIYVSGAEVITSQNLGRFGVSEIKAGQSIGVSPISGTGSVTISNLGVTATIGSAYIAVSASTGSVTIYNLGVQTVSGATGIAVSTSTGTVIISSTATLQNVTDQGASTNVAIRITNTTDATTSSGTGASAGSLGVSGGASIAKNTYVGGNLVVGGTVTFGGSATNVLSTNTVYTDNILELHIPSGGVSGAWGSDDLKDIGLRFHYYNASADTNAALVLAHDTKALEWYGTGAGSDGSQISSTATYGTFKTGAIQLVNTTTSVGTDSGALIVAGGVGIGGTLNIGGEAYSWASGVAAKLLTEANLSNFGVTSLRAGTGTSVSTSTGIVTVWSTASLQTVTDVGYATTNPINITNTTATTSSTTGALTVAGGVGIAGGLYVGGASTVSSITVSGTSSLTNVAITGILTSTNTTDAGSTITGALQILGGVGIQKNLYVYGKIVGGVSSIAAGTNASVLSGAGNSASGNYSAVMYGQNNVASGVYSQASGLGANTRSIIGAHAHGYGVSGNTQVVTYLLSTTTNSLTTGTLTADSSAPTILNQITMPNNSVYGFKGMVTARNTATNEMSVWEVRGGIRRGAGGGTTTLVGTPIIDRITYDSTASSWTLSILADTTNGGLQLTARGDAGLSIKWVANMTTIEVA